MKDTKKFIQRTFKELLNLDVRVINLPDDNIDMGIFVVRDKKTAKMSEKELSEFSFDYALTHVGKTFDKWCYITMLFIDGIERKGEIVQPPDEFPRESTLTYNNMENSLLGLINEIVKDRFERILGQEKI